MFRCYFKLIIVVKSFFKVIVVSSVFAIINVPFLQNKGYASIYIKSQRGEFKLLGHTFLFPGERISALMLWCVLGFWKLLMHVWRHVPIGWSAWPVPDRCALIGAFQKQISAEFQ